MTPAKQLTMAALAAMGLAGCGQSQRFDSPERQTRTTARAAVQPAQSVNVVPVSDDEYARDGRHDITVNQFRQHVFDGTAVIIDARGVDSFNRAHVRGAINFPASTAENNLDQLKKMVSPDQFVIIYCTSSACHASDYVYELLASQGYVNMKVFAPGWQVLSKVHGINEVGRPPSNEAWAQR